MVPGAQGKKWSGESSLSSARTLLEAKNAAAQIELIFVLGHAVLEGGHNPAMNVFAAFVGLNNARFTQDAKMFGNVVLRDFQSLRQFAHVQGTGKQFLHHAPPGFVRQGLEKRRAAL
jgi:hypothetical protein